MSKGVFKRKEVVHQEQIKSFSYHYERPLESPVSADMWAQAANSISKSDKQQMPTDLNKLPFVLPKNVDGHEKINNILKYSLHQQKVEEISDNAAIVTLVVSRCLAAADINHKVVYGYRKVHHDSNSSDNPLPFAVAPHVWMVIKDYIIDNAYIKKMPERTCNYLHDHMPGCYEESNNEFNELLALQSEIPDACRPRGMMKKRITFSMRHPDMALALGHNNEHFYNYFFSMIRHMYEEHKVTVKGIDPTIRLICWGCESYPQNGIHLYSDTLALRYSYIYIYIATPQNETFLRQATTWEKTA